MCSGGWGALRGTGPRTTGTGARFFGALRGTGPRATGTGGCVFFVGRGPVPRDRAPHPGHPVNPGHPASDDSD